MYSPKIKEEQVRQLYQLKLLEKKPMTKLVTEALEQYFKHKLPKMEVINENK